MTKPAGPLAAATPVLASPIRAGRVSPPVQLRTGQNIVPRRVLTLFGELCLPREVVAVGMQVIDVLGDTNSLNVGPGTPPNAVPGIDGWLIAGSARAEIGAPGASAGPYSLGQPLTVLVGTRQSTEIGSIAGADARDEEAHLVRLGRVLREHEIGAPSKQDGDCKNT